MATSTKIWSPQQEAIFSWFKSERGNLVVRARAGTGKTTTIIEGITHAPENKVLLCAFNKRIAQELTSKLRNPSATAKTLHSVGFGFVMRNWAGVKLDDERAERIAYKVMGNNAPEQMVRSVTKLASIAKGVVPFAEAGDLVDLAYQFDLQPSEEWERDGWTVERLEGYALQCMERACQKDGTLDFDDMVYVPVRNRWVNGTYDLVVVDEAQDMNTSQLILAQNACKKNGRIAVVGDDRQAIYGFRGADSNSIDRLKRELKAKELGLTITYRCPKKVVALAQTLVPDYQAAPSAPEGIVSTASPEKLYTNAVVGDFVLSRKNAPLAKVCLRLLRNGKRAKIQGKDIGKGLLALVRKLKGSSVPDFLKRLTAWETREVARLQAAKKKSAEARIEFVHDQAETLLDLSEGLSTLKELETRIETLFADMDGGDSTFIICSSVHRAKGLEAKRVYVLEDTIIKGGDIEEDNIHYVAITRAQQELVWVQGIS